MNGQRRVVFGLGSNLGAREATLESAVRCLRDEPTVHVIAVSSFYETAPVGGPAQGDFINAAVLVHTALEPRALLHLAKRLEADHGRERSVRFGPRTLDVDILWIEGEQVDADDLAVPHPRLLQRAFALVPLLEIAPDAVDPSTGLQLAHALELLDASGVRRRRQLP